MASYWFLLLLLIMSFMASPLPSLTSSQISSDTPTISASPVSMSNPPLSPFQELSPDIVPLLPSPGEVVPTTGSSMPTIPSTPSPPNPDDLMAAGPGSAFSPFGSLSASSTSPRISVRSFHLAAFSVVAAYCLMQLVRVLSLRT
ncbi:classical arabinogalactan protein 25-like [Durio zibethinus]|uniref:Classical arabinogalactan protein 25-like n=1 Tax=Durio zibethinus TaxID=66656 RepID=A0A6P5X608_DURZI|nr:classical arabinogalactan protein 25-like [Durio zibethinus]